MPSRRTAIAILLALGTLGAAQVFTQSSGPLVVHEWGTFTSVAGEDGRAVEWLPLSGPSDLPCFVERFRLDIKGSLRGKVRMETPVLYFYASHDNREREGSVSAGAWPNGSARRRRAGARRRHERPPPGFASSISWPREGYAWYSRIFRATAAAAATTWLADRCIAA